MNTNLKQCSAFDEFCCYTCKRFNVNSKKRLVKKLAVDPDDGTKYCNHWINNKNYEHN